MCGVWGRSIANIESAWARWARQLFGPSRDRHPRLRAVLDVRVIGTGALAVVPIGLRGRLNILWRRLHDNRRRVVVAVVRRRVVPRPGIRRAPPEPGAENDRAAEAVTVKPATVKPTTVEATTMKSTAVPPAVTPGRAG